MSPLRVAAKQLTASDLTFFAAHFHKQGQQSKQKAINLNSEVFVEQFFPGLRHRTAELHFPLTITGPGGAPSHRLSRKALRTAGAKNWRLDGELVGDPHEMPGRYAQLDTDDIALLSFEGTEVPNHVSLTLVSKQRDQALHAAILRFVSFTGRHTMQPLTSDQLCELVRDTSDAYGGLHPLRALLAADTVEEAVHGPVDAQEQTGRSDGLGVAISPESVRQQAESAADTGERGEEMFEQWLLEQKCAEEDYVWVSRTHARAAYDFRIGKAPWEATSGTLFIDVKTTTTSATHFHLSLAEIRWAASNPNYRIARVSFAAESEAEISILAGAHEVCRDVVSALGSGLPHGAVADSFTIPVAALRRVAGSTISLEAEA